MAKHLVPCTYIREVIIPEVGVPEFRFWRSEEGETPLRVSITAQGFGQARRAGKVWSQEILIVHGEHNWDHSGLLEFTGGDLATGAPAGLRFGVEALKRSQPAQELPTEPVSPPVPEPTPEPAPPVTAPQVEPWIDQSPMAVYAAADARATAEFVGRLEALQAIKEQAEIIKALPDLGAQLMGSQTGGALPDKKPPSPAPPEPALLKRATRRVNRIPIAAGLQPSEVINFDKFPIWAEKRGDALVWFTGSVSSTTTIVWGKKPTIRQLRKTYGEKVTWKDFHQWPCDPYNPSAGGRKKGAGKC